HFSPVPNSPRVFSATPMPSSQMPSNRYPTSSVQSSSGAPLLSPPHPLMKIILTAMAKLSQSPLHSSRLCCSWPPVGLQWKHFGKLHIHILRPRHSHSLCCSESFAS